MKYIALLIVVIVLALLAGFFYPKTYYHPLGEDAPYKWDISKCFGVKHQEIYPSTEFETPTCYGLLYDKECYLTPGRSEPTPCL
mgnify:FL=1